MLPPNQDIPAETRKVATAAFPKGSRLMTIRHELGPIFGDEAFADDLYPGLGQPA